ncbi:MAG TPA: nuclear transport factor 2 family protein [Microthrixaceae bacterium]|nr:nuclear transport factor 2 family protein [Microthrixaceae bacterium]
MSRWNRAEIEAAFDRYQAAALKGGTTGDWDDWVDCFTEDCTYNEHMYGVMGGREAIRTWIHKVMVETYPGNEMPHFPIDWYVVDEERGWIVCKVWNRMRDPGDGSLHQAYNLTILHYAGGGRFSYEEDIYNPHHFGVMIKGWEERKAKLEAGPS